MNPAKRDFVFPTAITFALFALLAFFGTRRPAVLAPFATAAIAIAPLPPSVVITPPEVSPDTEAGSPSRAEQVPTRLPEPAAPPATGITVPTFPPLSTPFTKGVVTIPAPTYGPVGTGEGPIGIATSDMLDSIPRALVQPAPVYPYGAKVAGRSGEVTVEFWVDTKGMVHDPRAVHSTADEFEEPAVKAVVRWRFEPGRRNGRIVTFRMAVPLKFTIEP